MSYKVKFEVEGYQCLRCEHKWVPRVMTDREPIICPKCKSPYWNRERRADKQAVPDKRVKRKK
jgi:DNA-directed RNA polymerase subunit RPC12/RpoP